MAAPLSQVASRARGRRRGRVPRRAATGPYAFAPRPARRAADEPARLRRPPRPAAGPPTRRALRRARGAGEGRAARPVLLGGRRELDRRRGALPGPYRPAPARAHPHGGGDRTAPRAAACGRRHGGSRRRRQRPVPGEVAFPHAVEQAGAESHDGARRAHPLSHRGWTDDRLGRGGSTLSVAVYTGRRRSRVGLTGGVARPRRTRPPTLHGWAPACALPPSSLGGNGSRGPRPSTRPATSGDPCRR